MRKLTVLDDIELGYQEGDQELIEYIHAKAAEDGITPEELVNRIIREAREADSLR